MKKFLLLLLSLVMIALLWFFYDEVDNEKKVSLKQSSSKTLGRQNKSTVVGSNKQTKDSSIQSVNYESLKLFWTKNLPLTDIELSLLSRMPAKDFIEMYERRAENGDRAADFFISYIKSVCASAITQNSKLDAVAINRNLSHDLLLGMVSQCASLFSPSTASSKLNELHRDKYDSQLALLVQQNGISFESLNEGAIEDIPEERKAIYKELRSKDEPETNIALYEGIARIKNTASLNSLVEVLSPNSMTKDPDKRAELAAWLLTSCASGYPCDYFQFTMNNLFQFCLHDGMDCRGKSVKDVVEEYVPNSSYEDVLERSMEISEYIVEGQGTRLLETYLEETKE